MSTALSPLLCYCFFLLYTDCFTVSYGLIALFSVVYTETINFYNSHNILKYSLHTTNTELIQLYRLIYYIIHSMGT